MNDYPYTDFHEMNLDWLLQKVQELEERVKKLEEEAKNHVQK